MASKMMILENGTTMCVRCANVTDAMEEEGIEHSAEVGKAVCIGCGRRIAELPEPPTYRYDVALQVTLTVSVEASSENRSPLMDSMYKARISPGGGVTRKIVLFSSVTEKHSSGQSGL
ncbi:MAG: hypothetical protein M3Z24_15285 [Chloroflexota bacterium]|nr:hypothetical protein [Chloroflexota bacterium]